MLVLTQPQMQAFKEAALRRFEDDMVAHLRQFARRHCEVIGEEAVRKATRLGIERARRYGLGNRGSVRFYIELMFMYGSDFDTDPQCAWAGLVLNDEGIADPTTKAEQLYQHSMAFTDKVAGSGYVYAKNALRRVQGIAFEDLPPPDNLFEAAMFDRLAQVHPEKVRALGEAATRKVIACGRRLPGGLSLAPERGAALCVGCVFALGHGFGHDPLLPWIERTITNPAIVDPHIRAKRLHSRIMTYLEYVVAGFGKDLVTP